MSILHLKLIPLLIIMVGSSVFSSAQCLADFTYHQNGFVVQFMDNSTSGTGNPISHYHWSFGDGMHASTQHPVHTYSTPGAYIVMHVVSTTGTCNDTVMQMVFISPPAHQQVDICPQDTILLQSWMQDTAFQWQVSTDSINYNNITHSAYYSGSQSPVLQLQNLPTSFTRYHYRCVAGSNVSTVYTIRFANYFTGSDGSLWSNPSSWSCGAVPDMNTDVIIPAGQVVISSDVTVRSLQVEPGATVTVQPGVVVTVLN